MLGALVHHTLTADEAAHEPWARALDALTEAYGPRVEPADGEAHLRVVEALETRGMAQWTGRPARARAGIAAALALYQTANGRWALQCDAAAAWFAGHDRRAQR